MVMARWTGVVQDENGNAIDGAQIEVRREEDNVLVPLFSNRAGTVGLSNPFDAPNATVFFHVAGGSYRIKAIAGAFEREWRYVSVGTGAELDAEVLQEQIEAGLEVAVRFSEQELAADAQGQARANIGADMLAGFRNKVINGNFDFWQRAVSQAVSGYGSADRWYLSIGTGAVGSFSRQAFGLGQSDVPGNPRFMGRLSRTTTGSTPTQVEHPIESVATLAGQKATLTVYLKCGVAGTGRLSLTQNFGAGGSPTAPQSVGSLDVAITTAWQKFTWVVDIPSIAGRTLGTNNGDYLSLAVVMPTAMGATSIDIAHVSLVAGDASMEEEPFAARHIGEELALCQRYYETGLHFTWSGNSTSGQSYYKYASFAVRKRADPSITVSAASKSGFAAVPATVENTSTTESGISLYQQANATVNGAYMLDHWTAEAEL